MESASGVHYRCRTLRRAQEADYSDSHRHPHYRRHSRAGPRGAVMADYTTAPGRVTCTLSSHARVARPGTGCRHRETGLGRALTGEIGSASASGGEARRSGCEGLRSGSLERVSSVTSRQSVSTGDSRACSPRYPCWIPISAARAFARATASSSDTLPEAVGLMLERSREPDADGCGRL